MILRGFLGGAGFFSSTVLNTHFGRLLTESFSTPRSLIRPGRHLVFDGRFLHGAPDWGPKLPAERRVTFLVPWLCRMASKLLLAKGV